MPGRWGALLAIRCPQWEPVSSSPPRVCSGELSANVAAAVISAAAICNRVASCPQRVDGFHLRGHDEYKREGSYFGGSRQSAQAHGYGGLTLRHLASEVGIKAARIYHHFLSKADLASAIAERYWQDTKAWLEEVASHKGDPAESLREYPNTFRMSLENGNRLCLGSLLRRRIRRSSGTSKEGGPELRRYQCSLASRAFDRSRLSCVRGERRACACSFRCDYRGPASCTKPFGHLALRLDDQELSRSRASSSLIRTAKYLAPGHPRAQDRFDTAIGALLTSSPENMPS